MIRCALYDYIEIACMDGYRVQLMLSGGESVIGRAVTTGVDKSQGEYLQLVDDAGQSRKVWLASLASMTVLSRPARFEQVAF